MVPNPAHQRPDVVEFQGFDPLEANYVYCPNQFLDLCIPNHSRGCVRIVGYILRRTLGWLDQQGNPLTEEIRVTWNELIQNAGVSRGAIAGAVKEAIDAGYLRQIRRGMSSQSGRTSASNVLALKWSDSPLYSRQQSSFDGFFRGEGHRTPVPNAFFDVILPGEPLAVTKVVGAVLRHTVGYQTQFGGRRQSAPLSYRFIAEYAKLSTGRVLANALATSIERGYVACLTTGSFHPDAEQRSASRYTIRWRTQKEISNSGSKKPSANQQSDNRFKKTINTSSKTPPDNRFKKATKEKTTENRTTKQQAAVNKKSVITALRQEGMDRRTARDLVNNFGHEVVQRQLAWLADRNATKNRVGLLRKAIEQDWSAPPAVERKQQRKESQKKLNELQQQQQSEDRKIAEQKRLRSIRRQRLLEEWGDADSDERRLWIEAAAKRQTSQMIADMVRRETAGTAKPMAQVLDAVATARNLPPVSDVALARQPCRTFCTCSSRAGGRPLLICEPGRIAHRFRPACCRQ